MLTAVDLFAGAGGSTTGAKMAGVKVLWSANHWKLAVETHQKNHPEVTHCCQDLRQADWRDCPNHDILLASPSCVGHTRARGKDRPHHDASRSTAWAVVDCVEQKQPKVIIVENVPEFVKWRHYSRWRECLADDYHLTENILDAADIGVPQNRVRLFVVGIHKRISKYPVTINKPNVPHVAAHTIINWSEKNWSRVDSPDRATNTIARVEAGRREFGRKPFLIAYYGSTQGGRSLDRPLGTVTTKDRYALVDGNKMRMLTPNEYKAAMGFPGWYELPSVKKVAVKLLGNAVAPPVMQFLLRKLRNAKCCI